MAKFSKIEKIREGGQATVWKAKYLETGRLVAMKFPLESTDLSPGEENRARFVREMRCQSTLRHPGVMPIIAMNLQADNPFYVMPLASYSLQELLHARCLEWAEAVEMIIEVLNALAYAHAEGIIHRDLKPENILLLDNRWVVSDFGLCKDVNSNSLTITRQETLFGSLPYMAPEQFDDPHNVTVTADIFAIGQILYYCIVGEVPYPRVRVAKIPSGFRYVITKCIAEEPEDRFQSVADLRRALELATAPSDELAAPTERAQELRERAIEGIAGSIPELLRFLSDRSDDEVFFKEFLPSLPAELINAMAAEDFSVFSQVVRVFDGYAEGGHPFSYTDELANFFRNVLHSTGDVVLRQVVLKRIFRLGVEHNRFYIGDVFASIVRRLTAPHEVQFVADLLRGDPQGARFMAYYLGKFAIPDAIRRELPEI
ncbi:serine/threonine protein kinase [Streptomyces sp. NBC_01410]|uniref:serine/threonine-protein kinase n=1 Tax=Streptomyces sp. NBC_01410 TaxID=2903856 RepID=UPI003249E6CA